ncbi:MAG: flagellin [Candidatus Marinimicrobia bacterium]|nr:flagellin [Candidatus Neomarinimicrobiota bacterium]MAJ43907.1 flagellin [Candidatus Neomarinimicrobiota bacterium]|tara:strand:+ start:2430 stop:3461 length:1032 start_codon:yes stop_codon:yes gene_type:complete
MFGNITTINSNFSAMEALYNLKQTNGKMGLHQTRLSTGKRINSAEDDAAGYHIAKHLESRTRGLSQALDNVSTAKNILNIAEGGYQSQMDILQQIKESLTQAADGSLSDEQRGAIGDRVNSLLTEFDDIYTQTKYNGFQLFAESDIDRQMTFQVGEESADIFQATFDASNREDVGENGSINLDNVSLTITDPTEGFNSITLDGGASAVAGTDYIVNSDNSVTFTSAGTYTFVDDDGDNSEVQVGWGSLSQNQATNGIDTLESAIDSLSATIQRMGDYQARLTSKEESLSIGVANTEASRSRIEDADFAKEQMEMVKLQILQQTGVSAFSQANSAPQVVLSLFK